MRILGIDPGLTKTGFGIIDIKSCNRQDSIQLVDYGIVKPNTKDKLEIKKYDPHIRKHAVYKEKK